MGPGVPGLAGESTASAVVSYKRGLANGVPPPSGAAERPGRRPKAGLPSPTRVEKRHGKGAGPRDGGGGEGAGSLEGAGPIDVIQLLRPGLRARPESARVGGWGVGVGRRCGAANAWWVRVGRP